MAGVESLVRWSHPLHGLIPPADFILIAKESGLIVGINAWIIVELGLCATLEAALRQYAVDPVQVELELTESILMEAGLEPRAQMPALFFLMDGTGS